MGETVKDKIIKKGIDNIKKRVELCTSTKDKKKYKITGISEPVISSKE